LNARSSSALIYPRTLELRLLHLLSTEAARRHALIGCSATRTGG
jgi:hypothetical protein